MASASMFASVALGAGNIYTGTFHGNADTATTTATATNAPNGLALNNMAPLGNLDSLTNAVDPGLYSGRVFGLEYLYAHYTNLIGKGQVKVYLSGDSTTYGNGITNQDFLPQAIIDKVWRDRWPRYLISNIAHSGDSIESYRTNGYLASDIANYAPKLWVIRFGINDGSANPNNFQTNLWIALNQIRTTLPVTVCSILLVTPESANDDPDNRGRSWLLTVNPIIRQAARQFQCAFYDAYADNQESLVMGFDYNQPYGGTNRAIHGYEPVKLQTWSKIADILIPKEIAAACSNSSCIFNPAGSMFVYIATNSTASYRTGISLYRALPANGWPLDGQAITIKEQDGLLLQFNANASGGLTYRGGVNGSAWGAWKTPLVGVGSNYFGNSFVVNTGVADTAGDGGFFEAYSQPFGFLNQLATTGAEDFYVMQGGTVWKKIATLSTNSLVVNGTVTATNFNGNAAGLTNLQASKIVGGMTTNIQFTDGLLSTNTLYFTNGILMGVTQP